MKNEPGRDGAAETAAKALVKALVVCGPTASGKSDLSDALADSLSERHGGQTPVVVVDSMQVYRELPVTTNQARRRPAEMVGVVSVTEEWTVARHKAGAEEALARTGADRFVLDAGTGMYLNAILLDLPLAPKVPPELRRRAQGEAESEENPRRAARARELALAGAGERGSIWEGRPRYATAVVYLRPDRASIDRAIAARSRKIAHTGVREAEELLRMQRAGARINPSVAESVGVKELTGYLSGDLSLQRAEDRINVRTRQLARRQIRWFDKLARALDGRAPVRVLTEPPKGAAAEELLHGMHGIMGE